MYKIGIFLGENKFIGGAHQYTKIIINSLERFDKSKFEIYAIIQNKDWLKYLPRKFLNLSFNFE